MNRKNRYLALALLPLLMLTGCASSGKAAAATPAPSATFTPAATATSLPSPTATPAPPCVADTPGSFAGYADWAKVNPRPIMGHELFVNIYVNDLAAEIYQSASGKPFPVCAVIVKTHLAGKDSDTVSALAVMVKMPAGFDPEHNDWWWGLYDAKGKNAQMSGQVQVCIACHQPAAAADYVFSQKVLEEIQKTEP